MFDALNSIKPNGAFTPKWSELPLQKSWQKVKPPLGWPRETDSLCPDCVREARQEILDGKRDYKILLNEKVGEIKAHHHRARRQDPDGQGLPACTGTSKTSWRWTRRSSSTSRSRSRAATSASHNDEKLHNHGSSTIKYGRGSVLTIDLTNRCNMMCDPCFMDANQVGFVHELSWEDIKTMLDNAISIKPKRQMSVQFSGGEPTMSPYFLDAVRYAKKVGYNSVQAATNGIEFAKSPEFAQGGVRGRPALRLPAVRRHRQRRQLAPPGRQPVRRQAARDREPVDRRRRHRPGRRRSSTASTTSRSAAIIQFALDNPKKINFLSFQPVSFTGRDEEVTPERRAAQRYTLSHLAHDVKNQIGIGEPVRDWFPISFMGTFTDWADLVHGPSAEWGNLTCGCHPNCGIGMAVMIDKETKEAVPVTAFLDAGSAGQGPAAGQRRGARPDPVGRSAWRWR